MSSDATGVVFQYTGIEKREDVPKDVTIVRFHSSVTEVGTNMFRECYRLKKVVLNEGLRMIGGKSFHGCYQLELEHINLPSTVTEIGDYAFYDCSGLKDVVLSKGLQKMDLLHFIIANYWRAFGFLLLSPN